MEKDLLEEIGLTKREKETYLKLLKKGECSASEVSKGSSISRTHVYEALGSLIDKGLVINVVKNFKKYYSAAPPCKISDFLGEKKRLIEKQEIEALGLIKQLQSIKPSEKSAKIEVYEGKEGIKTFMTNTLKSKEPLLIINATKDFKENFTSFAENYFKEKIKRKLKSKVIFGETFEFLDSTAEKRFLIKKDKSPTTTIIYEDNVAVGLWLEKPLIIRIKSEEASREYKDYFRILWKEAKRR